MNVVNCVLGPVATTDLGVTLMHEHLQASSTGIPQIYPELLGKGYKERIVKALVDVKQAGISTVVDCATIDLGRDIRLLAEVSERSGVNVIACTGWGSELSHLLGTFTPDQYAEIFAREVEEGIEGTSFKAGLIKSYADIGGVTPDIEVILRGVARAHLRTGIPIILHAYHAQQVARRQLAILKDEGVDMNRVKVDHILETTDLEYITWIVEQGVWLGMDKIPNIYLGHGAGVSPAARILTIKAMIDAGYAKRLLISHDGVVLSSLFDTRPQWELDKIVSDNPYGLLYIHKVVLPKLREMGVSDATIDSIMVDNARRFFEGATD